MMEVLREAKMAFALSIQSIWERQIRAYLFGCARELRPGSPLADKAGTSNWKELLGLFRELRGIKLESFPSFEALDLLHHFGNACRHGDGNSAIQLSRRCRDLWSATPPLPLELPAAPPIVPSVATMDIPIERLRSFVDAIALFWIDIEYIYKESIEKKHENLEKHLTIERAARTWFPESDETRS